MNCKPGDWAQIRASYGRAKLVGLLVRIERSAAFEEIVFSRSTTVFRASSGFPAWTVEASGPDFPRVIADIHLRPTHRPGEEVADEALTPLATEALS